MVASGFPVAGWSDCECGSAIDARRAETMAVVTRNILKDNVCFRKSCLLFEGR